MRWSLLLLAACAAEPIANDDGGDDLGTEAGDEGTCALAPGACAPAFVLPDHLGVDTALEDYAGQRVIVLATAMWCTTCRALATDLNDWYETSAPDDVVILDVVVQNPDYETPMVSDAADFVDAFDLSMTVVADVDGTWWDAWGPSRHSFTVIDSNGTVTWHQQGSQAAVDRMVEEVLAAP